MAQIERSQITRFKNCDVLRNGELVKGADVWVREGKVIDPQRLFYEEKRKPDQIVDCQGLIVAPGFIELQINGDGSPLYITCVFMLYVILLICSCVHLGILVVVNCLLIDNLIVTASVPLIT